MFSYATKHSDPRGMLCADCSTLKPWDSDHFPSSTYAVCWDCHRRAESAVPERFFAFLDDVVAWLRRSPARFRQMHQALRRQAIHRRLIGSTERWACAECGDNWEDGEPENHKPWCLAAEGNGR
jgi:rubrerythrin